MAEAEFPLLPPDPPPPPPPPPETDYWRRMVLRVVPPWLRRLSAARLLQSIASLYDWMTDRLTAAAGLRFPNADTEDALPALGRDRRIIRGPLETPAAYAARLRAWLVAHQTRGGGHALLRQLFAFHGGGSHVIELLYANGVRYTLSADGEISRDHLSWLEEPGAELDRWARVWVVHRFAADPGALTDAERAQYWAVPREWSAAHVLIAVGIAWAGVSTIWDHPWTVTWDELDAMALTWDELESRGVF